MYANVLACISAGLLSAFAGKKCKIIIRVVPFSSGGQRILLVAKAALFVATELVRRSCVITWFNFRPLTLEG